MSSGLAANVVAQFVGCFGAMSGAEVVGGGSAAFVDGGIRARASAHRISVVRSRRIIMRSHEAD